MLKLLLGALLLTSLSSARADTVRSVDQVGNHLKTPEAREFVAEQMQGKPAPDRLGVHLPPSLSAATVTRLLVPPADKAVPTLVGARPWPGHPDLYVAIVCTGGEGPMGTDPQCARSDSDQPASLHVYLGVIEAKDAAAPRLVAASGPVEGAMSWRDSGLARQPMAADDAKGAPVQPDRFDRFDLAPYKISPDQVALGLRAAWTESYSGGGAEFTGLCLFTVEGDRLKQVLAVPMSAFSDVAGDWHKDQTRDHDITDSANLLVVSPNSTNGHFDLIVKGRTGSWRRVFKWNASSGTYRPN